MEGEEGGGMGGGEWRGRRRGGDKEGEEGKRRGVEGEEWEEGKRMKAGSAGHKGTFIDHPHTHTT